MVEQDPVRRARLGRGAAQREVRASRARARGRRPRPAAPRACARRAASSAAAAGPSRSCHSSVTHARTLARANPRRQAGARPVRQAGTNWRQAAGSPLSKPVSQASRRSCGVPWWLRDETSKSPDGQRGVDRLLDVLRVELALGVDGRAPRARHAVGLQLERLGAVGAADREEAELVLQVVRVLVRDDVGDAEVARRPAEARLLARAARGDALRTARRRSAGRRRSCRRPGSRTRRCRRRRRRSAVRWRAPGRHPE